MSWTPVTVGPWSRLDWRSADPDRPKLDPYLLWAETCRYPQLTPQSQVPVMIELNRTTARGFARFVRRVGVPGIAIPGTYLEPVKGVEHATFLTALVSQPFVQALQGPLGSLVRRMEYSAPVVPGIDADGFDLPQLVALEGPLPTLVAVIDDGIAFAHERFRTTKGNTRFSYFWNQDAASNNPPQGLGYGADVSMEDVNNMLAAGVEEDKIYRAVGYRHVRRRVSHGTHVCDFAAGSDQPPSSDIMGVQLPDATLRDTSCLGLSVNVLDALRYLLDRAAAVASGYAKGKTHECPLLVNLSYAKLAGPHDGSSMLEKALDELINLRHPQGPLTLTLPAGNHRQARCHAAFELAGQASRTLEWRVMPDDITPSFLEIWCSTEQALRVTVRDPSGSSAVVERGDSHVLARRGKSCALVSFVSRVARGQGTMVLVAVAPTASVCLDEPVAQQGAWRIMVENLATAAVEIKAWIQRDEPLAGKPRRGRQSRFEDPLYQRWDEHGRPAERDSPASAIQRRGSLSALATGDLPVVLGGYQGRDDVPAAYTAQGDGRNPQAAFKVDDSPVLRGRLAAGSVGGSRVAISGTSVAAPQALRLLAAQTTPDSTQGVHARQTIEALAMAAELARPPLPPPDELSGAGRLDTPPISNRRGLR